MRICLIGKNLTNFVLAMVLVNKKLNIDIIYNSDESKINSNRTIGISKDNLNFLNKNCNNLKISKWPIKKIKIYGENKNYNELFEFQNKDKENFFLIKYSEIYNYFQRTLLSKKKIKFIKFKKNIDYDYLIKHNKYNLIINSDSKNKITLKYFSKKIEKNYDSKSYTTIIDHKKIENNVAVQIFTKFGPLAFLPFSNTKTSIVFSLFNKKIKDQNQIIELIKKYNFKYLIKNIGDFEMYNLKFSILRKYYYKNILSFGDLLHKIHPLAGQGFNMTIRDIKILSSIIDEKLNIGLELDHFILEEFEKKTKHRNYIFASAIDFIHEFFKLDNNIKNVFSKPAFKIIGKNKILNKYATHFANFGLDI